MALFGKKNNDNNVQFEILPKNIGIIMDGNGRWAKKRALPRSAGHKAGAEVFRTISKECGRLGLESATFYAFSTENWKRPKEEVDAIMRLFKDYLLEAKSDITAAGDMKMKFIGERDGMSIAGVHRVRVHDLRHSHASLLINMGESPLLLKERLGHEKIQTTLGTYGHLYPNTNQAVAKKLTGILNYSEPKTSIANYTSNQHTADYHRA